MHQDILHTVSEYTADTLTQNTVLEAHTPHINQSFHKNNVLLADLSTNIMGDLTVMRQNQLLLKPDADPEKSYVNRTEVGPITDDK